MTEHCDDETLFLYLSNDAALDSRERRAIAAHLDLCDSCSAALDDLREFKDALTAPDLRDFLTQPDPERDALREIIRSDLSRIELDASLADDFYAELRAKPFELWSAIFDRHPDQRTPAIASRILRDVEVEMNRLPKRALQMLAVVEKIAEHVSGSQSVSILGDVWKQRANAYRHLFQYQDSLFAADLAEQFYRQLTVDQFDVAQARTTAAITLFKMTEYQRALDKLDSAITMLRAYGSSVPYARALILQANIYVEQGDVTRGVERFRSILRVLDQLGDKTEEARVLFNLADCNLRLGHYAEALADAEQAAVRFTSLQMEAESVRATWTLILARIKLGDEEAIDQLHVVAGAFDALDMAGDAAFVRLDLTEELLLRGEWGSAAMIARELVPLFTKAHVTLASINAAEYLHRAVQSHEATPELVQYVRDYVSADDPARPFTPPQIH